MNNLLLVEDDPAITGLLELHFCAPDYAVTACERGSVALERLAGSGYDLIILDIGLPDTNGIELCRRIRQENSRTPILMLSALSEENDKVQALELGADDYLTKPFGIAELMARVKALLRRGTRSMGDGAAGGHGGPGLASVASEGAELAAHGTLGAAMPGTNTEAAVIDFQGLVVDKNKRKVTIRGLRLELTPKEFDLLWLLASHPGKTFSRHELLEIIWGFAFQEYEHTVTSHINRLRLKIEPNLNKPQYILTTWGAGYRFAE